MTDQALFHWSPVSRRKQIIRYGLRPKMWTSTSAMSKRPYICFAETPSWAWALSGAFHPEVDGWDLWQTSLVSIGRHKILPSYDEHLFHEVRAFDRVYKRYLWWVATRTSDR